MRDVDCVSLPKTASRMDAGFEPPWMGSRCVFGSDTRYMSRCQYMSLRPLLTADMNRKHLAETRHEPTYTNVGNADIASLHGCNLLGQCRSYCRGANICHPWGLGIRIPAADGLSKVLPIHASGYLFMGQQCYRGAL